MAVYYQPTLMQKQDNADIYSDAEGQHNPIEIKFSDEKIRYQPIKRCLSCGSWSDIVGQLPCGH